MTAYCGPHAVKRIPFNELWKKIINASLCNISVIFRYIFTHRYLVAGVSMVVQHVTRKAYEAHKCIPVRSINSDLMQEQ